MGFNSGFKGLIIMQTPLHLQPHTLRLHMKDTPLHRRRFYTHNLNGIDLQKLHIFPKNVNLLYSLELSLFILLLVIFNLNTCCIY